MTVARVPCLRRSQQNCLERLRVEDVRDVKGATECHGMTLHTGSKQFLEILHSAFGAVMASFEQMDANQARDP